MLVSIGFVLAILTYSEQIQATIPKLIKKRRGSSTVVWALFTLAIVIVVGSLLFAKVFPKLDAQRDSDFTAAANATIAGVESDFFDAVDLMRIALIIVPIVAVLAYVFMIRGRGG